MFQDGMAQETFGWAQEVEVIIATVLLFQTMLTTSSIPAPLITTSRMANMATQDIEITQGKTFRWFDTIRDNAGVATNLDNCNVRGMGRKSYSDASPAFTFTIIPDPDQTTNTGKVIYYLSPATTAALTKGSVKHYDIEIEMDSDIVQNNADVYELWRGNVTLTLEDTKG